MTKQKGPDKNLQNVVKDLEKTVVNSHQAQQVQQQTNDHRHQDALNHEKVFYDNLNGGQENV